jgi:hypothetical protein
MVVCESCGLNLVHLLADSPLTVMDLWYSAAPEVQNYNRPPDIEPGIGLSTKLLAS